MSRTMKALVAVAGAALLATLVLGTALAQTDQGAAAAGTDYRQAFLDRLAAVLGVDRPRLDSAIKQANTDVIDQAEKNGDLSKNQADALRKRVENGEWPGPWGMGHKFGRFGHGRFGHGPFGRGWMKGMDGAGLDAAATALGISRDELLTQLRDGKTLGEIADARGVDRRKVQDALVAAHKQKLDDAVKNGNLTQKQADQMLKWFQGMNVMDMPIGGCATKWYKKSRTSPATGTSTSL